MKKVYQTVIDPKVGNCMQAAIASLFDLDLTQVPNFILYKEPKMLGDVFRLFIQAMGYDWACINHKPGDPINEKDILSRSGYRGVNGYYYAGVNSLSFPGQCTHAVIIDKDGLIVHDPNSVNSQEGINAADTGRLIDYYVFLPVDESINIDITFSELAAHLLENKLKAVDEVL